MAKKTQRDTRPSWAKRIEKLRRRLGVSQTTLGNKLSCSAMAVSRWERGVQEPPANLYIQLGNMVGEPDCWFFWGRAGLYSADLLRILPALRERLQSVRLPHMQIVLAGSGARAKAAHGAPALHAIPLLPIVAATLGGHGDVAVDLEKIVPEGLIAAPDQWCPNPSHTTCLKVKGDSMAPLIHDGSIIVVDTSETDNLELHGQIVVAWQEEKGLTISRLQSFDQTEVLVPENREFESVTYGAEHGWRIIGKVLWWIGRDN